MKKFLMILALLVCSQFQISISPREVIAQDKIGKFISSHVYYTDGMTYRIFVSNSVNTPGGLDVVNVTKDKLEVEKLKLEIEKLKKR